MKTEIEMYCETESIGGKNISTVFTL